MTDKATGNGTPANELSLDALANSLQVAGKEQTGGGADPFKVELPDINADPEGFKKAAEQVAAKSNELEAFMREFREQRSTEKITSDINSAVDFVASQVEGVEKRVLRAIVKDEIDSNPTFKRIWDARDSNPDAYSKALGILSQQYREQFAPKVDPQISADQRAFQESVRAARGSAADAIAQQNSQFDGKSDAEFDVFWHNLAQRSQ